MSMLRTLAVALLVALCTTACNTMPFVSKKSRAIDLDAAATQYGKMLRWGYYEEAASFLRTEDGSETLTADLDRIARYRIASYKVGSMLLADNGREGRVLAVIEYYEIDSGRIDTQRYEQFWWHDPETDRWFLGSPLPSFGAAASGS